MAGPVSGSGAGLAGLFGLFADHSEEQSSGELLDLMTGLSEQLGLLDPNGEWPEDLQNQLTSLLQLFQDLLKQSGHLLFQQFGTDASSGLPVTDGNERNESGESRSPLLIQALQQTLRQFADHLMKEGTEAAGQASLLTEPVKNALNMVQQLTASNVTGKTDNRHAAWDKNHDEAAVKTTAGISASQPGTNQTAAIVQPEVRKAIVPLRNPAWPFNAAAGTETAAGTGVSPVSAEAGEISGSNGSAPVWTFLKGDAAPIQTNVPTDASLPAQVPARNFADLIGKFLVKQFILTKGNGTAEAKISLHPEHLGQVDIRIMLQNGQLTAQFMTETGSARELLETQMMQLRTALQAQGLQVDRMEVVQQSSAAESASFFQSNQGQHGAGQHGENPNGRGYKGVYGDSAGFEAELDRTAFLREIGYGSSLNVTA